MDNKCLLIINPISGTTNKRGLDKRVARRLESLGLEIETAWTTARGDATRLAGRAVAEGYHTVIAAGGDGTVNETARALCGSDVRLGIIPCGSGNGLARHLDIPIDIEGALDIIAADCPVACDYGTVNSQPFFCTFGVGFDAAVSHKFARQRRRGPLSYLHSTFREFVKYHADEYTISANGQLLTERAFLVAVCNASQYGNNAFIAPTASIHDGVLDITVIHSGDPFTRVMVGVELFTGRINSNIIIQTIRTPRATIRKLPGTVHIDGDVAEMPETVEVECHPSNISIFCDPKGKKRFRPILTPIRSLNTDIRFFIRFLLKRIMPHKKV